MSTINVLGPVGFNPTGPYDATRTYQKLDVVYYQGSSYVAISDSIGQLPTNEEYWNCIALGSLKQFTYNSVAEMKADNSLENGMFVETVGYYEANDGGAAIYKIRTKTNEDTPDEMTIFTLNDESLVAELIINNDLIVKQLGAKGDGETDDTTILQKIIDYAYANSYNVKFTRGTYIYTSLTIKDNVNVYGDKAILKLKDNTCIDNTVNYYPITMNSNTSIKNMELDGNKDNNTLARVADTITTAGNNITIDNCHFYNTVDSAIMFSETINSVISNCKIDDARDCGIYCNNNNSDKIMNSIIRNNIIKNSATSGIAMKRGCRYLNIVNNYLLDCDFGITSEQANTTTDFSKEFNIIGNTLMSSTIKSIGIDTRGGYFCNIKDNRIINYLTAINVQGSHDINVENNIIELYLTEAISSYSSAILLQGRNVTGFNYCYNINVLKNIINLNYYESSANIRGAIRIEPSDNTSNILIENNDITCNTYGTGIVLGANVKDIVITNNNLNTGNYSIITQARNLVTNNNITSGALLLNGPSYFMKDNYGKHYKNASTNAPTQSGDTYSNGDIVYAKYGSSPIFAWMYDGTNWRSVSFDS